MNPDNAIEVDHISKSFKVYYDKGNQLKERILFRNRNRYERKQVLKDISFSVKRGEGIGLIGHNGCGKSTTLKMLTRIMSPDKGSIAINGRVAALIELGAGFHPDMTGRENIYTNAAIFGLTKSEIDEKMDDIIAFSELEEAIDVPVRTYSSGMYMRLAFSVAINVDADILLIDEILAVGDAAFQAKCFNRLKNLKENGATIVIVSHSLGQIEAICDRSIWIHEGLIREEGEPSEIHAKYLEYVEDYRQKIAAKEMERQKQLRLEAGAVEPAQESNHEMTQEEIELAEKRKGTDELEILSVQMYDSQDRLQSVFKSCEKVRIKIAYHVKSRIESPYFAFCIMRYGGTLIYTSNTQWDGYKIEALEEDGEIVLEIPQLILFPDTYGLDVAVHNKDKQVVCYKAKACSFEVVSHEQDFGACKILHSWESTCFK